MLNGRARPSADAARLVTEFSRNGLKGSRVAVVGASAFVLSSAGYLAEKSSKDPLLLFDSSEALGFGGFDGFSLGLPTGEVGEGPADNDSYWETRLERPGLVGFGTRIGGPVLPFAFGANSSIDARAGLISKLPLNCRCDEVFGLKSPSAPGSATGVRACDRSPYRCPATSSGPCSSALDSASTISVPAATTKRETDGVDEEETCRCTTGESRLTGLNLSFGSSGFRLFGLVCVMDGVRCNDENDPLADLAEATVETELILEGVRTKEGREATGARSGPLLPIVAAFDSAGLASRAMAEDAVPMPSASSPSRSIAGTADGGGGLLI